MAVRKGTKTVRAIASRMSKGKVAPTNNINSNTIVVRVGAGDDGGVTAVRGGGI